MRGTTEMCSVFCDCYDGDCTTLSEGSGNYLYVFFLYKVTFTRTVIVSVQ